jgi:hypothetical protein
MDGTVVLEPVLKNLPAQGAVEWSEGCPRNWRGPTRPRVCGPRSAPFYNQRWEMKGSREGVGGGRSSDDGQDSTIRSEREGPLRHRCIAKKWRNPDECRAFG